MVRLHATSPVPVPDRVSTTARLAGLLDDPPAVLLTSSCTHALEASMLLAGVGPGDEVVVPAFTLSSTANAALLRGATVRFADVRAEDGNIDPVAVDGVVGPRTRAVVCVHYGGVAADVEELAVVAATVGADLVEDAAHGLFARWQGTPLGRFGRLGALSFHRTKNLSTVEGGALVVNDPDLVDAAQVAVDKGTDRYRMESGATTTYEWAGPGSAWRMADPMVTLLEGQLDRASAVQARRHQVWDTYRSALSEWAAQHGAALPHLREGVEHPAHLFWIQLPDAARRDDVVAHCADAGIEVAQHYGSLPDSTFGRTLVVEGD
ncbi:MAG: aminotransferase class I/II-fold pyridoxal phosphate-dependent enzyme, partial [Actinomycetes bacterium]